MSNNYIDIKHTVWERFHYKDDINIESLIETLKNYGVPLGEHEDGFVECETLYDTLDEMSLEENNGLSTIEIYSNNKLIYENGEDISS